MSDPHLWLGRCRDHPHVRGEQVAIDTVDRDWAFEKVIWKCIDLSIGSPEDYYVPVEWQISQIEIE